MLNIKCSLDLLPDYRKVYNGHLLNYIESFMTESRISILKEVLKSRTKYITLIAENLIDEHNIHAMIRSSECFGLQDFHNIGDDNVRLKKNKSVNRGAFQWTHIYDYTDCEEPTLACIHSLKSKGFAVYGTSSNLSANYTPQTIPIDKPLAIIMGKEHEGMSQTAIDNCDGILTIPMYGFTESFNVSVAASLILQPIVSRVRDSDIDWKLSSEEMRNLYYEWIWYNVKRPDQLYKEYDVNNSNNSLSN